MSQLVEPPRESRLLRVADNIFVEKLKEKMILDPSAPGATPMAVLCRDLTKTEQFNEKFLNVYKYEVLGGLHTLKAKHQLIEEYPENPFYQQAIAEIYVHLSDEQALRLAQCHNLNSHFVHKITHRDLVSQIYSDFLYMLFTGAWKHAALEFTELLVKKWIARLHLLRYSGRNRAREPSFLRYMYVH